MLEFSDVDDDHCIYVQVRLPKPPVAFQLKTNKSKLHHNYALQVNILLSVFTASYHGSFRLKPIFHRD